MAVRELRKIQNEFLRALRGASAEKLFKPGGHFYAYKSSFSLVICSVLEDDFPTIRRMVGHQEFKALAARYQNAFPSNYWTLALVGENLSEFLKKDRLRRKYPFLSNLAEWEWSKAVVLLAPAPKPFQITEDVLGKSLELSPYIHLLKLNWSVHKKQVRERQTLLVVFRSLDGLVTLELEPLEWRCLRSLSTPVKIEKFLNLAARHTTPRTFQNWLKRWVENGMLRAIGTQD